MLCNICPRHCDVNRKTDLGFCTMTQELRVARAALHFWEEPCISGDKGSGTVFFSGCNMRCVFCQNKDISHGGFGKTVTVERLAEIFLELGAKGALNINLVTPTHFTLPIIEAVKLAKKNGLKLPIIYNTSGYETQETIKKLEGTVDVYLPDFKYFDDRIAQRYSCAKGYSDYAKGAIEQMVQQVGQCTFDENGIIQKGVIVRVLVLPTHQLDAKRIIQYLYKTYRDKIFISIMSQYTPGEGLENYPEINRKLNRHEYDEVVDFACGIGVKNGFVQEGEAASESFIPAFDLQGVENP
ncbi:MAG: radical SAM protein [Oscillospiraceae bacterium]